MAGTEPTQHSGANKELKKRLNDAVDRQGLTLDDIVREIELAGERVSKSTVHNARNPVKGPPSARTLNAILNALGIGDPERQDLLRLRARASRRSTSRLELYLEAVERAARQHPYPGALGAGRLPALADVYVRQHARSVAVGPGTTMREDQIGQAVPAVPATEVFDDENALCVLLGQPGGGKSTLLRAHLADSADRWLGGQRGQSVPAMVRAAGLTGADLLPAALARSVTADLRQAGLLDEPTADFFRHPPSDGVPWLVLVDGLDEIPDADTQSAVLTMLTSAAEAAPGLYRFVIATRPLPAAELGALGRHVPCYELQPFSPDDLRSYAHRSFQALDDPGRHTEAFLAGLGSSRLEFLARIPLLATMLCQLYAADPARPLPEGRGGAYQSFVELIYKHNHSKKSQNRPDETLRRLEDRHQIPGNNQAARQVSDHLPELIDHLAHERFNGSTAPAVDILASHLHAHRPHKVKERLWHAFLTDLLRCTGILTEHAGDFDFPHQTLLEYHAASHATRDEQACAQLLDQLFPPGQEPQVHTLDPSYLGFLIDALLVSADSIAAETVSRIEAIAHQWQPDACDFLVQQVLLQTNLPTTPTARQLIRFAEENATGDDYDRVRAAWVLARVKGYRIRAAQLLAQLADDRTLHSYRTSAAWALATVNGYRAVGVDRLIHLAGDTTLDYSDRVQAAENLARVEGYQDRAAQFLAQLGQGGMGGL